MTTTTEPDCMIAIVNGEVMGAIVCDARSLDQTLAEWTADPSVTEIVRVPVSVPRKFLFEKWPGRDAAIAACRPSPTSPGAQEDRSDG